MKNFKLVSGSSYPLFANKLADKLGLPLTNVDIGSFPDNETRVRVLDDVQGDSVFILQSIAIDPDRYLMQLMILGDALKRSSAKELTAVLPYYAYGRQDRRNKKREPITAKLVADLLERAGFDRVITMDLHTDQVEGFFNKPVENLDPLSTFFSYLKNDDVDGDWVVVAADIGSIKRARNLADMLGAEVATVFKHRIDSFSVKAVALMGDVKAKRVILVDDMCTTAETLAKASILCRSKGALEVRALVTHGLFVEGAKDKIENSTIDKMYISDTIPGVEKININNLQVISVVGDFVRSIEKCLHA